MLNMLKTFMRGYDVKNDFFKKFIKDNYKILDLGGGVGNTAKPIKLLFPSIEYHVCDIMSISDKINDKIIYHQVDLDSGMLPYPNEYFDTVIFTHVIEHLKYPLKIGKEINRVMKRGGNLY